jgi:hypothetical protein
MSLKPGDLVRHSDVFDKVGIVIRCYTTSHRPLEDEYEIFWGRINSKNTTNTTIESEGSLKLLASVSIKNTAQ